MTRNSVGLQIILSLNVFLWSGKCLDVVIDKNHTNNNGTLIYANISSLEWNETIVDNDNDNNNTTNIIVHSNVSIIDICPVSALESNSEYLIEKYPTDLFNRKNIARRSRCPLKEDTVDDMLRIQTWYSPDVNTIREMLRGKNQTIRIFISGGSMTAGTDSQGCCVEKKSTRRRLELKHAVQKVNCQELRNRRDIRYQALCGANHQKPVHHASTSNRTSVSTPSSASTPPSSASEHLKVHTKPREQNTNSPNIRKTSNCPSYYNERVPHYKRGSCTWGAFLTRWFKDQFPDIHFEIHMMAASGFSSDYIAEELLLFFKYPFSSTDIIFLDHSVNDAVTGNFIIGFESLIRRIYHLSIGPVRPVVIVLEQFYKNKNGYPEVYRVVAERYQLILWSFVNVGTEASTHSATTHPALARIPNYSLHPPWYIHKLLSELYATAILRYITTNEEDRISETLPNNETLLENYSLPIPLLNVSVFDNSTCSNSYYPLLARPDPSKSHQYRSTHEWTISVNEQKSVGWSVTSSDAKNHQPKLSFPVSFEPIAQYQNLSEIFVKISYTRMPPDGGFADVILCGEKIVTNEHLSSLWPRFLQIPRILTIRLPFSIVGMCLASNNTSGQTLDIIYRPAARVANHAHQYLVIYFVTICQPMEVHAEDYAKPIDDNEDRVIVAKLMSESADSEQNISVPVH